MDVGIDTDMIEDNLKEEEAEEEKEEKEEKEDKENSSDKI